MASSLIPIAQKLNASTKETEYGGLSITATAKVDTAEVRVVIDVGFGDSVEPGLEKLDLPDLLDFPTPAPMLASTSK